MGPLGFFAVPGPKGLPGRPRAIQEKLVRPVAIAKDADKETAAPALPAAANGHGETRLEPLVREWLLDLQVLARSPKTIDWYRKHVHGYFQERSTRTLDQVTAAELKQYLAAIQARPGREHCAWSFPDDQGAGQLGPPGGVHRRSGATQGAGAK